ncbi:hypothetical protein FOL47_006571 [Perkinsus chesapeaki]|uniref:Uncharacterized protein n=1 Tax=Perkinsus chesapeaki TaxID=330153 RepID=A0A7J6MYB5_PERCH|nr:hypothetical protein FOL47_006571 [Perkinsus chesapeaki]
MSYRVDRRISLEKGDVLDDAPTSTDRRISGNDERIAKLRYLFLTMVIQPIEKANIWQQFLASQTTDTTTAITADGCGAGDRLNRDHSAALILGVPGCGKRTLFKTLSHDIERQLNKGKTTAGLYNGNARVNKPLGLRITKVSTACQGNEEVKNRAASTTNVVSKDDELLVAATMAAQAAVVTDGQSRMAPIDFGYLPALMRRHMKGKDEEAFMEIGTLSLFYCEHPQHHILISKQSLQGYITRGRFVAVICLDMMNPSSVISTFEGHLETLSRICGPLFDTMDITTQEALHNKIVHNITTAQQKKGSTLSETNVQGADHLEWLSNRGYPIIIVLTRCDAFDKIDPMKWRPVIVHLRHRASHYGATIIATDSSEFSSLRESDAINAGITARNGRLFYDHIMAQVYGGEFPEANREDGGRALIVLPPGQDGGPDQFRRSLNEEDADFLSRPIETFFDSEKDDLGDSREETHTIENADSMKVFLSRMAERMPPPPVARSAPGVRDAAATPVTNRSFFQNLLIKDPASSGRKVPQSEVRTPS